MQCLAIHRPFTSIFLPKKNKFLNVLLHKIQNLPNNDKTQQIIYRLIFVRPPIGTKSNPGNEHFYLQTGSPIQPTMYGLFFEDINYGADGGLYAELIKNRSFEFPQSLMCWQTFEKLEVKNDGPFERNLH